MKLEKKIKLYGIILGVILFALLTMGLTYAWFTWRSGNTNISGTSGCFTVDYTKGQNISAASVILLDESKIISNNRITIKNGMALTDVTASIDSKCTIEGNLNINLNINNLNSAFTSTGKSTGALKYVVASYDPSVETDIAVSALNGKIFDIIMQGSIINKDQINLVTERLTNTRKGYLIIFYIDGDLAQNDAGNSSFSATIEGVATQIPS